MQIPLVLNFSEHFLLELLHLFCGNHKLGQLKNVLSSYSIELLWRITIRIQQEILALFIDYVCCYMMVYTLNLPYLLGQLGKDYSVSVEFTTSGKS